MNATPPTLSLPRRLVGVFVSPAQVFDSLRERPSWIVPLLFYIGVGLVLTLLIPESLIREMVETQMSQRGEVTSEQVDAAMKVARAFRFAAPVLWPVVQALAISGILFLVFNLFTGADARFAHYLAGTTHGLLIQALGAVVTTPLVLARQDLETRLSLALVAPGLESGFLYNLLNAITIFGIWTALVLGIAGSRLSRRVATGPAVGILLGLYGAWALVNAMMASLRGS